MYRVCISFFYVDVVDVEKHTVKLPNESVCVVLHIHYAHPQSLHGAAINDDKWPHIVLYIVQNDEDYNVFFPFYIYLSFDCDSWAINQDR